MNDEKLELFRRKIEKQIQELEITIKENVENNNFDTALKNIITLKGKREILKDL